VDTSRLAFAVRGINTSDVSGYLGVKLKHLSKIEQEVLADYTR
jgi:hypothetical protein